jgi:YqcI/YcgG family
LLAPQRDPFAIAIAGSKDICCGVKPATVKVKPSESPGRAGGLTWRNECHREFRAAKSAQQIAINERGKDWLEAMLREDEGLPLAGGGEVSNISRTTSIGSTAGCSMKMFDENGRLTQRLSACPFEKLASVTAVKLDRTNPKSAGLMLRAFAEQAASSTDSILVISSPKSPSLESPEVIASYFNDVVRESLGSKRLWADMVKDVEQQGWRLRIKNVPFFALALSPCYRKSHPRHHPVDRVLVFQPEGVFTAFGITTGLQRAKNTAAAKDSFRKAGQDYFDHHTRGTPKAYRFVLDHGGEGLPWWEA